MRKRNHENMQLFFYHCSFLGTNTLYILMESMALPLTCSIFNSADKRVSVSGGQNCASSTREAVVTELAGGLRQDTKSELRPEQAAAEAKRESPEETNRKRSREFQQVWSSFIFSGTEGISCLEYQRDA